MPEPQTIQTVQAAAELTEAQKLAKQLVNDSDLALQRLVSALQAGFEALWGTKDNPKPKEECEAILAAMGGDVTSVFARHKALVTLLITDGLATFEPWETKPAYVVNENGSLGDLAPEWTS